MLWLIGTQLLQQHLNKLNAQKASIQAHMSASYGGSIAPASTAYSSPPYSTPAPAPVTKAPAAKPAHVSNLTA